MISVEKYNLPDIEIFKSEKSDVFCWTPGKTYIVLGQRDKVEKSLNQNEIDINNIKVFQRPSGGHAVVLTPNTLVVAMVFVNKKINDIKPTFQFSNKTIIKALEKQKINGLKIDGISDIVAKDKKISGSSMFFDKNKLFFHAVLNISENPEYIAKFLKHPETEPEYRKNREHTNFITSIESQYYHFNRDLFARDLTLVFKSEKTKLL